MRHKNKRYTAPDRVEFGYSFQIALGIWERIGVDVSLKPGETIEGKLSEMQERLQQFHKRTNPQLYKTGNEAIVKGFDPYNMREPAKVINRAYERMELLINDCTSIEELSNHKDYVNKNPDLMPVYMNKLKSLEKEIAQ